MHQQGQFVEQWTIMFEESSAKERALINVRFAPSIIKELIEFEVELNPIPIEDE